MLYDIDLKWTGLILGLVLVALHGLALAREGWARQWLTRFPRDPLAGKVLLTVNGLWAFWIVLTMDLGEFEGLRRPLEILVPVAWLLVIFFVEEFLSVRALGVTLLLGACVLLDAAWFEDSPARLLLPVLAYVWIVAGMIWVGMPFLFRDATTWLTGSRGRWRGACLAGLGYGLVVMVCALWLY